MVIDNLLQLCLCFVLSFVLVASNVKLVCNIEKFGTPQLRDCETLFPRIADLDDRAARLFVEEDLLAGQGHVWPAVPNPFRTGVVQIPKFWSYGGSKSDQIFNILES